MRKSKLVSIKELAELYSQPLPATRSGPLFSAFSYPTKISPESIAVFIASHTKPGDTVLDVFAGSGTTGFAAMLCADPPPAVVNLARQLKAPVQWGPRNAILYELSTIGAFIAQTMTAPPDEQLFLSEANALIARCEARLSDLYAASGPQGEPGVIRHAIWTEIIECPNCGVSQTFWDAAVRFGPLRIEDTFVCPTCHKTYVLSGVSRLEEEFKDPLLQTHIRRRRRELAMIYGSSNNKNWKRRATAEDRANADRANDLDIPDCAPLVSIPWGDLYRSGYHTGITHAHHFYTNRNWLAIASVWDEIDNAPRAVRNALRLLTLSYNATHATLMTRVVVKQVEGDFVLTGAQSGVLYVSSLPVEKNLFVGLKRKAKTLGRAFSVLRNKQSSIRVVNASSRHLDLPDNSVDYVFTDPPFGGFIPYSEINFLNEIWLGRITKRRDEIIVSDIQAKTVKTYGSLMSDVFVEIARVLNKDGKATIVFHSGKADVWRTLQTAHLGAGLQVALSSVLDKIQGSFKQVNSMVSVKGDPLLLLTKVNPAGRVKSKNKSVESIISELVDTAVKAQDIKERTPERLYSRFVARCMENKIKISIDASGFYSMARERLRLR